MKLQVGVKAIIRNTMDEMLIMERSQEKYGKTDGHWDIPGGRIDPGHSLRDNLIREIREETSLDMTEEEFVLLVAQDIILEDKGIHVVRLTYKALDRVDVNNITVELDTDENISYKWLNNESLLSMEGLDYYLKEILERK